MKKFKGKILKKIIPIFLVFIFLFNFIMPNYVYADTWETVGGVLFKPIKLLACAIGDAVMNTLQNIFITSNTNIKQEIGSGLCESYDIRYSPGIIFSGKVRGLDINFINPDEDGISVRYQYQSHWVGETIPVSGNDFIELVCTVLQTRFNISEEEARNIIISNISYTFDNGYNVFIEFTRDENRYMIIGKIDWLQSTYDVFINPLDLLHGTPMTVGFYEYVEDVGVDRGEIASIAEQLRPTIAKWYKATRLISMVGLLSVLLYVGIRIITSSTAGDKAKYKKMLMDWLTALCILFILHYIMVFILTISKQITNIFVLDDGTGTGVDPLISNIANGTLRGSVGHQFAYTVMYIALVVLTVIFTFQYLKRVLYMAFLTMIAPLIALTYPLDKIKDGQAQAFTMWIREYIFNALIQPVHLLIYVMLVGTATDLMNVNPIYAIVAISFIVPAEKFLRKMFGFEKASTVGQLGAAAGGAMIMNMINKAKHAGGKAHGGSGGSGGGASSSKGVRTPTPAPDNGSSGGGSGGGSSGGSGGGSGGSSGGGSGGTPPISPKGSGNNIQAGRSFPRRIGGVVNAVGKKYKLWGAGSAKQWAKKAAGLVGAGTLGTIGLAAGVATGDLGNAAKYAGAGALAGYAGAGGLVESADGLKETVQEGYLGEDEYANKQFDKKFYRSQDYLRMKQKYSMMDHHELKQYTQKFLDAGITDIGKMERAIDKGLSADDAIMYNKIAKACPSGILHDESKFKAFLRKNGYDDSQSDEFYKNTQLFS